MNTPAGKKVNIKLEALLRGSDAGKSLVMPLAEGMAVRDALTYVKGLHPELTLDDYSVIVTVNDELVQADRLLAPGDVVMLIPPIEGG